MFQRQGKSLAEYITKNEKSGKSTIKMLPKQHTFAPVCDTNSKSVLARTSRAVRESHL
jgi:hypothetical protein